MTRLTEAERWMITEALEHYAHIHKKANVERFLETMRSLCERIEAAEYIELGPEELTP